MKFNYWISTIKLLLTYFLTLCKKNTSQYTVQIWYFLVSCLNYEQIIEPFWTCTSAIVTEQQEQTKKIYGDMSMVTSAYLSNTAYSIQSKLKEQTYFKTKKIHIYRQYRFQENSAIWRKWYKWLQRLLLVPWGGFHRL